MKGVIVGSFTGWVEQTRGLMAVDEIIGDTRDELSTGGAYTVVGDYPTAEFVALVDALARREGRTRAEIMREFGRDAYRALAGLHPAMVAGMTELPQLLLGIENVIHRDVRKLYSDSQPPEVRAMVGVDGGIEVTYRSHRHLTPLCHGLLEGAVASYGLSDAVELLGEDREEGQTVAHFAIGGGTRDRQPT
jgi:hypothetical protein